MRLVNRRNLLATLGTAIAMVLTACGVGDVSAPAEPVESTLKSGCNTPTWVGAWNASPAGAGSSAVWGRADPLSNQTFRAILTPLFGGSQIRVKLSNAYGKQAVTVAHATVAVRSLGAELVASTVKELTFGGQPSVVMWPGADVVSDAMPFQVEPFTDLAVSVFVEDDPEPTTHAEPMQTSYVSTAGDFAADPAATAFTTTTTVRDYVTAIDVLAPRKVKAIVTLGDSITGGTGSTRDANHRYPDYLARRLLELPADQQKPVLNAGIGGNQVTMNTNSRSAQWRLPADVMALTGAADVILLEGINDNLFTPGTTAEGLIGSYKQIAARLHAKGMRVFISPMTPPSTAGATFAARDEANAWIREHGAEYFDGVIDFDAAVRDPNNPQMVAPEYGGSLHPNDAGYEAMANAIDLGVFTPNCE